MVTKPHSGPSPHIAPRARHITLEEWIDRAVELAWKDHTIGTLHYQTTLPDGSHIYTAASRSIPHASHTLVINLQHENCTCDCTAASWGSPCSHVGAALYLMEQCIRSTVARNMAGQRQYEWWATTLNDAS